ncbi:MAG: segregation and condensation protein A [Ktedonobacterales bacterium]
MAVETREAFADVSSMPAATADDEAPDRPYTVHLPGFEGPLDLLLHLIERNQLEITTISLVAVTDQFIKYLRTWDEPPLPRLAEFVAMAARLLLIKSRSLLPRQPRQEESTGEADELDDAEQLRRHLIEYKTAREIARALRAREIAGLQSFSRVARLVEPEALVAWTPPQLVGLNVHALAMVFRRVLTEKRLSEPAELPLPLVTVADKIAEVEDMLRRLPRVSLMDVLRTADSRFAVVVTFLAVLELWHQGRLLVQQEQLFGPIEILPGPRFADGRSTSFAAAAAPESILALPDAPIVDATDSQPEQLESLSTSDPADTESASSVKANGKRRTRSKKATRETL